MPVKIAIPRESIALGKEPMDRLFQLWQEACQKSGSVLFGLVRDWTSNAPISLRLYHDVLREIAKRDEAVCCEHTCMLSSYSLRRFQCTGADVWHAPWALTVALGWKSKAVTSDGPRQGDSLVPVGYAGRRFETETFGKVMLVRILKNICQKEDSKTNILWTIVRKIAADKPRLQLLAKELAEDLVQEFEDVKEAFWATDDVEAHRGRRFKIPPRGTHSSREAAKGSERDVGEGGDHDDDGDRAELTSEGGSDSEDDVPISTLRKRTTQLHQCTSRLKGCQG